MIGADDEKRPRAWRSKARRLAEMIFPGLVVDLLRGGIAYDAAFLRLQRPRNLFQPYRETFSNRYPNIFRFVRERVGDGPERRILSFGCATGEEIVSLSEIFREATIRGIDVNPANVAACTRRLARMADSRLSCRLAGSAAEEADGAYDAIFAMAVFRHGRLETKPSRCDHLIRFDRFEQTVSDLARCLKPGGFLIIRHASFRFTDTSIASQFHPLLALPRDDDPTYDRHNALLTSQAAETVVFLKMPDMNSLAIADAVPHT